MSDIIILSNDFFFYPYSVIFWQNIFLKLSRPIFAGSKINIKPVLK